MHQIYFNDLKLLDKGYQSNIDEIKKFITKNKNNKKIVETIFANFTYNKKYIRVNNGSGKRLISNRTVSIKNLDFGFKQNYLYIKEILEKISSLLSDEFIFKNLKKPTVGRILSLPESEFQGWHYDYAPRSSNGWQKYFENSKQIGISPLSLLHFPEGGSISLLEGNMDASKRYLTRASKSVKKPTNHRRQNKYSFYYIRNKKIYYRTLPCKSKIVKLKPNESIIFR